MMIDLVGRRIGRLQVVSFSHIKKTGSGSSQYFWNCTCDCGKHAVVDGCCLRRKSTRSCGCYARERSTKHGAQKRGSPHAGVYNTWLAIKQRCRNRNNECFKDYGGRGIDICDEWYNSFQIFFAAVGPKPTPAHTIERIKNHLGYVPGNVRWATRSEQNENTRQTRLITFDGITLSQSKWARRIGITVSTLRHRIDVLKLPLHRALSPERLPNGTPLGYKRK